jgi:hypothetical protein
MRLSLLQAAIDASKLVPMGRPPGSSCAALLRRLWEHYLVIIKRIVLVSALLGNIRCFDSITAIKPTRVERRRTICQEIDKIDKNRSTVA